MLYTIKKNCNKNRGLTPPPVKPRSLERGAGFTLIELMITAVMIAVISLAIYATLNNGIKVWQKINKPLPEEDLNIFLSKFAKDLRGTFKFSGIQFLGKEDRLELAALINSQNLKSISIGKIVYSYNYEQGTLKRETSDYSQIYSGENIISQESLKNIKSLSFKYYFYDIEKKEYVWYDEWKNQSLPLAVRLECESLGENEPFKIIKTVNIPSSG